MRIVMMAKPSSSVAESAAPAGALEDAVTSPGPGCVMVGQFMEKTMLKPDTAAVWQDSVELYVFTG